MYKRVMDIRSGVPQALRADAGMKIMIVEDDAALAGEIAAFLEKWGYRTFLAEQFAQVVDEFLACRPQLVLMDVNLPFYDGFYWCAKIREISQAPVLYISSRNDDRDKIMAIAQGGDDYMEKPFHLELLRAKVEALLRRTYQYRVRERMFLRDGISYDAGRAALFFGETELELTRSEKKIVSKLLERKPEVVTREELMEALWDTDEFVSDGTLTTIVSRLRSKIKAVCGEELIVTKKGLGYLIQ